MVSMQLLVTVHQSGHLINNPLLCCSPSMIGITSNQLPFVTFTPLSTN